MTEMVGWVTTGSQAIRAGSRTATARKSRVEQALER